MSFDYEKFEATDFTERTKDVAVPQLKSFFPDGEKPVWKLRCITNSEMFYAREQAMTTEKMKVDFIEGIFSNALSKDMVQTLKEKLGVGGMEDDGVHREVILRRWMLIYGSVPRCPEHIAVKLSNECGEVFKVLTDELFTLYHAGNLPGKPQNSGEIAA